MSFWYGRDVLAALLVVFLYRYSLNGALDRPSVIIDVNLAFYSQMRINATSIHTEQLAKPTTLDLDGDGLADVLLVPYFPSDHRDPSSSGETTNHWAFRAFDLQTIHRHKPLETFFSKNAASLPLNPHVLFTSSPSALPFSPIHLTTAHVTFHNREMNSTQQQHDEQAKEPVTKGVTDREKEYKLKEERRKRYFCGRDWQDAITTCAKPCPSGNSIDCPDGEICFADTPCAVSSHHRGNLTPPITTQQDQLHNYHSRVNHAQVSWEPVLQTPHGGFPCVVTLWSDGSLSLQGLSSSTNSSSSTSSHGTRFRNKSSETNLDLFTVWRKEDIFTQAETQDGNESSSPHVYQYDFYNVDILMEKTITTFSTRPSEESIIIVAAHYSKTLQSVNNKSSIRHYAIIAIDTLSSRYLWLHHVIDSPNIWSNRNHYARHPQKASSKSSLARRRSILSYLADQTMSKEEEDFLWSMDCPIQYKSWLYSLPMEFWNRIITHIPTRTPTPSLSQSIARSTNGNVGKGALYLSFFQRKHGFQFSTAHGQDFRKRREYQRRHPKKPKQSRLATPQSSNVIVYMTPDNQVYLHSLRNGSPICILRNPRSLSNDFASNPESVLREKPPSEIIWNATLLLPIDFGRSVSTNPTSTKPVAVVDMYVDSLGMSLWLSHKYEKRITFSESILDMPSFFDIDGDGFVDIVLVHSLDGYSAYRVCVKQNPWMLYSSPLILFVGIIVLFVGLAALYNHKSLENNRQWGRIRSRHGYGWLGARSSEKDE